VADTALVIGQYGGPPTVLEVGDLILQVDNQGPETVDVHPQQAFATFAIGAKRPGVALLAAKFAVDHGRVVGRVEAGLDGEWT